MTISKFTIKPVESLKNWHKLIFTSRRDGIGETTTEMLVSDESLRMIRNQISVALGDTPDYSQLPEDLQKFMEDRE